MKAITLRQPFASLFVSGAKLIETRSWPTPYRGPLAVHASAVMTNDERNLCLTVPFAEALGQLGYHTPLRLPLGVVLGKVEMTDCLKMATAGQLFLVHPDPRAINITRDPRLTDRERAFGHYAAGRFAWITSPGRLVLDKPIPARGMLGLWELPADIAELIP